MRRVIIVTVREVELNQDIDLNTGNIDHQDELLSKPTLMDREKMRTKQSYSKIQKFLFDFWKIADELEKKTVSINC